MSWQDNILALHRRLGDRSCPHGMAAAVYCTTCVKAENEVLAAERSFEARLSAVEGGLSTIVSLFRSRNWGHSRLARLPERESVGARP